MIVFVFMQKQANIDSDTVNIAEKTIFREQVGLERDTHSLKHQPRGRRASQ